jgi:hypothetical protein
MKNERLMDVIGTVSPAFVAEAAPGNVPAKTKRPVRPVRLLIAAAIIIATLMVSVLGMTISAEDKGPVLQEVPVMMLQEDFDRLIAQKMDEIDAQESTPNTVKMSHMRFKAFYEFWCLDQCSTERAREALLERVPITELSDVYTLDLTASDADKKFVLDALRSLGFTQLDLIECYERMYELAEESDSENKDKILASLPEIPERPNQDE